MAIDTKVAMNLLQLGEASQHKPIFVHEMKAEVMRWHYGDCFPDTDSCAIPIGQDIEKMEH